MTTQRPDLGRTRRASIARSSTQIAGGENRQCTDGDIRADGYAVKVVCQSNDIFDYTLPSSVVNHNDRPDARGQLTGETHQAAYNGTMTSN